MMLDWNPIQQTKSRMHKPVIPITFVPYLADLEYMNQLIDHKVVVNRSEFLRFAIMDACLNDYPDIEPLQLPLYKGNAITFGVLRKQLTLIQSLPDQFHSIHLRAMMHAYLEKIRKNQTNST